MANLNKVMLIGRLTRDPETRAFANGGRVAKFGFAVNNRKKNSQTGEWEEDPVFLDCEAFNRGETGKLADNIERFLRKGSQAFIEGHLQLDKWDDKTTGEKRQKIKVVVEVVQFLDPKQPGEGGGPGPRQRTAPARGPQRQPAPQNDDYGPAEQSEPPADDIPF